MIEFTSLQSCEIPPDEPLAVAMGFFDGVHAAHRRIIETCIERARAIGGRSMVFTFQNHPSEVVRPDTPADILTPYPLKKSLIEALKPDYLLALPFTRDFSRISPDEFVNDILRNRLHADEIVVGFNFSYGHKRQGTPDTLKALAPELFQRVTVIEPMQQDDAAISSSRIRALIAQGDLEQAGRLLERPYAIAGEIERGDGRGRGIGIPTANIGYGSQLLPPNGVYGVRMSVRSETRPGVMNIGVVPTFKDTPRRTAEVHLLDFDQDIYGEFAVAEIQTKIRDEKKFSGVDELIAQIRRDIQTYRDLI